MKEIKNIARVLLNNEAKSSLNKMMELLKAENKFIKVNPSKLVSWILQSYAERYFSKEKEQIVKDHFNSKEYLKHVTQRISSEDDLEAILKVALDKVRKATHKGFKGKKQNVAPSQQ